MKYGILIKIYKDLYVLTVFKDRKTAWKALELINTRQISINELQNHFENLESIELHNFIPGDNYYVVNSKIEYKYINEEKNIARPYKNDTREVVSIINPTTPVSLKTK